MEQSPTTTKVMIGLNESSMKGYPHASISSRWTLQKIVRDNTPGFKLLLLHVQVPDEDAPAVACDAWIRKGDPKEVICHEVQCVQPDFLVVGCRGLGPFQSEFCMKHAECPVITIKRRSEEMPEDPVDD